MILITAKQTVKPDKVEDFLNAVGPLIKDSQAEEGCIEYNLYRSQNNSNILTFVEKWKDMDAIEAHNSSAHFTTIVPRLKPFLEDSEVVFHDPV